MDAQCPDILQPLDLFGVDDQLFIVIVIRNGSAELGITPPHAVDLAAHPERFSQVRHFDAARQPALEADPAHHIQRAHLHPGGGVPMRAVRRLGT